MKDLDKIIESDLIKDPELQKKIRFLARKIKTPRNIYMTVAAEFFKHNYKDMALKYFRKADSIKSDYLSLYNIGCLYYSMNEYKKSVITLEHAKEENSDFSMIYLVTGLSYSMMSNSKAAESNFITVLMSDPGNETALTALSIMYYNRGEFKDSMRLIDFYKSRNKSNKNLNRLKTNILYETGKLQELVEEIKNTRKTNSEYKIYDDYIKSVKVQVFTDKYGTIDQKIEKLKTGEGDQKRNLISLSLCHLFSGNTDSAIEYLFQARELV